MRVLVAIVHAFTRVQGGALLEGCGNKHPWPCHMITLGHVYQTNNSIEPWSEEAVANKR
jgi:hypothetical protein